VTLSACGVSTQWSPAGSIESGCMWVAEAALQNVEVHERVHFESGVTSRRQFGTSVVS